MAKKSKIAINLFFVLGILILAWMLYRIGFDTIIANLRKTGWWFAAMIGLWGLIYLVNAVSFHTIIRDGSPEAKKVSYWRTLKLTITGYAINYITPFGLMGGEPYKVIELKEDVGIQKATSSVLLYTMMHFVSHFIFWMVSIPMLLFVVPVISFSVKIILIVAVVASMSLLYWSFTVYTRGFVSRGLSLGGKLPFFGRRIKAYKEKHIEKIIQMDELIADLYKNRKKDFTISLSLELLARYIMCIEIILAMFPIGYPVTLSQSIIAESIGTMVSNLFFFMPLQLSAREGGFALAFGILAIPAAHGVYVSLCMRIREIVWTLIGLGLIRVKRKK